MAHTPLASLFDIALARIAESNFRQDFVPLDSYNGFSLTEEALASQAAEKALQAVIPSPFAVTLSPWPVILSEAENLRSWLRVDSAKDLRISLRVNSAKHPCSWS